MVRLRATPAMHSTNAERKKGGRGMTCEMSSLVGRGVGRGECEVWWVGLCLEADQHETDIGAMEGAPRSFLEGGGGGMEGEVLESGGAVAVMKSGSKPLFPLKFQTAIRLLWKK